MSIIKKLFSMLLISVLVLSNATISMADTGPIRVNGYINIGEGYEGEDFSVTTTIYNDSVAYHNVTIEIQDNDINLCVDKTKLRIPGNQGINVRITGKYPKADNPSIFANLKIVDDLNYTNDQEIHFYASKVLKKDQDDNNDDPSNPDDNNHHNPGRLSPVKNVKIRYDNSKQSGIFTWDPVDHATCYYLQFLKPSSQSKVVAFNITHTKTVYTNRAEVEMRPDVGVILRIQAVGNKYSPNNDCVAYLKRKSGRRGHDTITTTYNEFLEEYKERYSTNPRRRNSTNRSGTGGNTNNGNTRRDRNNGSGTRTSYNGR